MRQSHLAAVLATLLASTAAWPALAEPDASASRARYSPLLLAEAARHGLPPALADAVVTVESGYDPSAIGASGEVGLMQVMPATAALLGFRGTDRELAEPGTNLRLGMDYLAGAWRATGGRLCDTLTKYRAGYGQDAMSALSVDYCRRARTYLAGIGSPLAEGPGTELSPPGPDIPPAFGRSPPLVTRAEFVRMRHGQRTAEDSRRYWIAEEARIRTLRTRLALRRS